MEKSRINESFWDDSWNQFPFERYYGVEKYLAINRSLDRLLKRFLTKEDSRILEIGCARAKHLIYFAKEFGYKVYGVDLSKRGVEVARDNLRIAKVQGVILCEDIFKTTLKEESFDIVYSMGLIEHFDNLGSVIDAHTRLLRKGGKVIITVPNFRNSLYLSLSKFFGVKSWILKMHNLEAMDKKKLSKIFEARRLELLFADYIGALDFTLAFGMVKSRLVLYPLLVVNQIVGYLTLNLPSSKFLSPYLVIIARKD